MLYFGHSKLKVSQFHPRAYKGSSSTIGFRKTEENLEDVSIEVNVNFRSPVPLINLDLKIFSDTDRVKIHGMSYEQN